MKYSTIALSLLAQVDLKRVARLKSAQTIMCKTEEFLELGYKCEDGENGLACSKQCRSGLSEVACKCSRKRRRGQPRSCAWNEENKIDDCRKPENPKKTFLRGLRKSLRKGRYCSHLESDWNCSSDFPVQGTTCTKACTVIEGGEGVQRCLCDDNGCYWDPELPHGCFGITSRSFTIVGTQETTLAYDHAEDEGKPHCAHSKFLEKLGKIFDKLKPDDTLAMAIVENGTMHSLGDFDETIENFYS